MAFQRLSSPLAHHLSVSLLRRSNAYALYNRRLMSSTTNTSTTGPPPFKKYMLITTGIMLGIPSVLGAGFVYNLKHDDDFYEHFNEKYPDLIEWIDQYYPLNEDFAELANRTDIGPIASPSEIQQEKLQVVAELKSQKKVRFQVQGSATQEEIFKVALSHSLVPNDRVLSIQFDESNYEDKEQEASVVQVEEIVPEKPLMAPPGAWPSQPQASWGRKVDPIKDIRRELEALRVRQAALEESKFSGRDVDEADAEIQEIEIKKEQLKKLLPRKRFLYIF